MLGWRSTKSPEQPRSGSVECLCFSAKSVQADDSDIDAISQIIGKIILNNSVREWSYSLEAMLNRLNECP